MSKKRVQPITVWLVGCLLFDPTFPVACHASVERPNLSMTLTAEIATQALASRSVHSGTSVLALEMPGDEAIFEQGVRSVISAVLDKSASASSVSAKVTHDVPMETLNVPTARQDTLRTDLGVKKEQTFSTRLKTVFVLSTFLLIIIDWLSKALATTYFPAFAFQNEVIVGGLPVLNGLFSVGHFMHDQQFFLEGIGPASRFIPLVSVATLSFFIKTFGRRVPGAMILLTAGVLGNGREFLLYGATTDWLSFGGGALNLGDVFALIGGIIAVSWIFKQPFQSHGKYPIASKSA